MSEMLQDLLIAILAAMLIVAVVGDIKSRTIPNWLNAAIALAAIPYWIASDRSFCTEMLFQISVATAVFALFAGAF